MLSFRREDGRFHVVAQGLGGTNPPIWEATGRSNAAIGGVRVRVALVTGLTHD